MNNRNKAVDKLNTYKGISASSGIVIGRAYVLDRELFVVPKRPVAVDDLENEMQRFKLAVEDSLSEMTDIKEQIMEELEKDVPLMIFNAHLEILRDPSIVQEVSNLIEANKCNAEWALKLLLERYRNRFSRIKDSYARERVNDIEQTLARIQRNLMRDATNTAVPADLDTSIILVAHDLTPSDTLQLDTGKVIGIATDVGGKTSHAGIIAASMDIPAVVGLKTLSKDIKTGESVIVDGNNGMVILKPTSSQFVEYNSKRQKYLYFDQALQANKHLEAKTLDGKKISVLANIESSHDLVHLKEHGAEGVGLYRTEYLYINRNNLPDEEKQFDDYKRVATTLSPNPAIIRTFDLGGDKLTAYMNSDTNEPNPALGLRAIRFCLRYVDLFKTQLRAVLRASAFGSLKIMYPLITDVQELKDANAILESCKEELRLKGHKFNNTIEVGIMIETPSAVMIAPELAKHCSFFSIGTNDLIQYTMAIDRVNEKVAYLYQPLSPAIISMLDACIKAADNAGIAVSVCGKMAGDPTYALLLIGLGNVQQLSMDVHSIPKIKQFIRTISLEKARKIASTVRLLGSTKEVKNYMFSQVEESLVEGISSDLLEDSS